MKETLEKHTREELAETVFKLIEDVGYTEDLIEEIKKETKSIREMLKKDSSNIDKLSSMEYNISLIQEEQVRQAKIITQISDNDFNLIKNEVIDTPQVTTLTNKVAELEKEILLFKKQDFNIPNQPQKSILKKEIVKWQKIILGILIFLALQSIYFFTFVFEKQTGGMALLIFFISILPFCIAMFVINNNLKKLISEDKSIPANSLQK